MKKLTITVEDEVYKGLQSVIGKGNISSFLNDMARPHVISSDIEAGYLAMSLDDEREKEASEWEELSITDLTNDNK